MRCRRFVARPSLASLLLAALLSTTAFGCGEEVAPAKTDTGGEEQDIQTGSDGSGGSDVGQSTDGDTAVGTDDTTPGSDTAVDPDAGTDTDTTDLPDGSTDEDTTPGSDDAVGSDDAGTGTDATVKPDVPQLKLPDCAKGSCTQCQTKCPLAEICVDGTTYKNDCEAICALKSYDWPANYQISPKKCPDCAACANVELKCDTAKKKCVYGKPGAQETLSKTCATNADCVGAKAVCATLEGGAQLTVELPCDVECLQLQPNPSDPTKTIAPTAGACKSACSQPPPNGGGCSNTKYQPVCAKQDGKTYAGECHMQNCDTSGCYPIGATTASAQCVADAMTVECVGECFEDAGGPQCDKACNPTCGILPTGKGQSFRNACLAGVKNAKVNNCDGISTTDADICSAEELYKAKGCCPDVDYTVVQPICAARQSEKDGELDKWVTFRSQAEFDCLTKGDNLWIFKYQGACICNCSLAGPEVCGADGITYANKCQAECFNPGGNFSVAQGPCP